jgi:hypothetical protein
MLSGRLSDSKTDDNPRARYGKIQFPIMNIIEASKPSLIRDVNLSHGPCYKEQ